MLGQRVHHEQGIVKSSRGFSLLSSNTYSSAGAGCLEPVWHMFLFDRWAGVLFNSAESIQDNQVCGFDLSVNVLMKVFSCDFV